MSQNFTVLKTFKAYLFNRINSIEVQVQQLVNGSNTKEIWYTINGKSYTHQQYWSLNPIEAKG
jgi:hypothetical protein